MKYNLHTHSFYCHHGHGTIADFADYAERAGFGLLGFSEHCPLPNGRFASTRMDLEQMPLYENDVLKEKNRRPFSVKLSYECDYFPQWKSFFQDIASRVDYLITGTHFLKRPDGSFFSPLSPGMQKADIPVYVSQMEAAVRTGLFSVIAHPDAFLAYYPMDSEAKAACRDIIALAEEYSLPLEINGNGLLKGVGYPSMEFWQMVHEKPAIKVIASADAHYPEALDKSYDGLRVFASSAGVTISDSFSFQANHFSVL